MRRWHIALLLSAILPLTALGQPVPPQSPRGLAPLLYVRFNVPTAMRVTFYQGASAGKSFDAPVTVGIRPGYLYRVQIGNLPDHPGENLYPTLEVRGALHLPVQIRPADYPVPVGLTAEDIARALAGGLITKVIYLESPSRAQAVATNADQPLETDLRPGQDPLDEARALGRPMLVVRLGGRALTSEEMARESVAGTILFPNEKMLAPPASRPWVPWACWPVYDPILGPRPAEEECLRDGDSGQPVGLDQDGKLYGLDPADTVAEYKDSKGKPHIAISNPVCICVPRFALVRSVIMPTAYDMAVIPGGTHAVRKESLLQTRQGTLENRESVALVALRSRERPSETENRYGTIDIGQLQVISVVSGRMQERVVTGTLAEKCPPPPDRPLFLCKSADKQAAHVGDLVTFTLRYSNRGGQPITDVVVSDSLTGRLEYVPGSARSDRDTVFMMQDNEAGSHILRWQIGGTLQPGQTGVVTFQAKVR